MLLIELLSGAERPPGSESIATACFPLQGGQIEQERCLVAAFTRLKPDDGPLTIACGLYGLVCELLLS
ncbi:unannotated protein [freshwater metagenome]|uniref:Unannotated protein n=1 Tax=freshwater metagenome TaxID=449393 RepID=A0A6J7E7T4_9ZZZZ